MDGKTYIDINLNLCREQLLMGIKQYFSNCEIDITGMVNKAIDNIDVEKIIQDNVSEIVNQSISKAVKTKLKESEEYLDYWAMNKVSDSVINFVSSIREIR